MQAPQAAPDLRARAQAKSRIETVATELPANDNRAAAGAAAVEARRPGNAKSVPSAAGISV